MRKLAPALVSYREDFLISYRVYMMTGSFHIAFICEATIHVDKIHVPFKIANMASIVTDMSMFSATSAVPTVSAINLSSRPDVR